jgi:hypothetical protein
MEEQRRLMPYEHQLVEALGITKDEYLDFVAQQHVYTDIKEGTVLDIRNELATVVALVLTIVGTILQVASALLAKPADQGGQRAQTRDKVFAPRSGFNSVQELASYGDAVNLVYTNIETNRRGGVRIATSLLWSSIKSFGSSQYLQLLLLAGAGGIGRIDYERTALGQTPIRDLIAQNYWLYFRPNGTGAIRNRDQQYGGEGKKDPGAIGARADNPFRIPLSVRSSRMGDGFSHAISPATSNSFGAYGPVPINVDIIVRNEAGREESANNEIKVRRLSVWGPSDSRSTNKNIAKGETFSIVIKETKLKEKEVVAEESNNRRRSLVPVFDNAAIFKLGAAKFAVITASAGSTDEGDVVVNLRCVEEGRAPSTPYSANTPAESARKVRRKTDNYRALEREVRKLLDEDTRTTIKSAADLLRDGRIFKVVKRRNPKGTSFFSRSQFKRNLTKDEKTLLKSFIEISDASGTSGDDRFFTKALVKIETATYETISPCHIVDLALRARVFRRINGRQEKYGSKRVDGYPISDNGLKQRSAMFLVKYKKGSSNRYSYVKGIFVVRRAAEVDNYIYLRFNSGETGAANADVWSFELEPVHDTIAEIKTHRMEVNGVTPFFYLENSGKGRVIDIGNNRSFSFTGNTVGSRNMLPPRNNSPDDTNEWDLFSNTADTQLQMSFDQGPEFLLTAVTEQIRERFNSGLYEDLSLVGFNLYSGRNVQDLRSMSLFVEQGRRSRLLRTSGVVNGIAWGQPGFSYLPSRSTTGYANTAPDIFVDTIDDKNDGVGKYIDNFFSIDLEQLARSKKFCERNRLFMDGVIAEPVSWRQFWVENALFSLLELTKQDGKESLIPAVPYDRNSGRISRSVPISALFTPGNILEGSYKEEFIDYGTNTEDVIVSAIYRDNERNGAFPRNNSVEVKLSDTAEDNAIRETIDMSAFVTRREQAILAAKFLCQTRRHSRRAIEFKTFPTDSFVAPGSFIYVELAQNQWNRIQTGIVGEGGSLNLALGESVRNGTYQVLLYNPTSLEQRTVYRETVSVAGGTASTLRNFKDHVFVLGRAIRSKRVFRVVEVAMDEEGEVQIKAVEHPCDANGLSLITRGLAEFVNRLFTIDGRREQA